VSWQPPESDFDWKPPESDFQLDSTGKKNADLASTLYHGAIEGGAMTVGGAAGAILGSPAGPVGSALGATGLAAAMYPPAKRVAEAIDTMRGITPPQTPNPASEFGEGLAIEASGAALKPAFKIAGKLLPGARTGEMLSGTPAQNLKRAYKQGIVDTYWTPQSKKATGEAYGQVESKLMTDYLTPEDQAAMLVNPRGEANAKVAEVYTKFLKGEPITAQDAIAARKGIDTVFPPQTGRNAPRIAKFSEFRTKLNEIIGEESPEFQKVSKEYAESKLRSDLSKPFRVNKSNPDQYSKLGGMFGVLGTGIGAATGTVPYAVVAALATSPLAMGLTASLAGSLKRGVVDRVVGNPTARRALLAAYLDRLDANRQESR
jgi:hypothetical protein